MSPFEKKRVLEKALNYWYMLDFYSQENRPKKKKHAEPKNGWLTDCFELDSSMMGQGNWTFVSCVEKRRCAVYRDTEYKGKPIITSAIYCHIGAISREVAIGCLDDSKKSIEKDTDVMTIALLGLTPEGRLLSFEISPLLWRIGRGKLDGTANITLYEQERQRTLDRLQEEFGDKPLTFNDIKTIIEKQILPISKMIKNTLPVDAANELVGSSCSEILVEYKACPAKNKKGEDNETPELEVSLSRSFFAKDIQQISKHLDAASSLDSLRRGPLKLLVDYLDGALEDDSDRCRIDMLDQTCKDAESFFEEILSSVVTPAGRWPGEFSLSLMQQVAVNLAAGCKSSTMQYPANDVMSVNGPPGTGKTTLLKDIVAANIVEKARLLCEYEEPDGAFEEVPLSKDYLWKSSLWRFKNDEISDLGILVCSTNNAAVENIAKELPSGRDLLEHINEDERAEFLDDDLSWYTWREGYAKKDRKDIRCRDLYFSRAADGADGDENAPGLLLAACLGNSANINGFRDGALDKLVFDAKLGSGSNFIKARNHFRKQYELVKEMLDRRAQQEHDAVKLGALRGELRATIASYNAKYAETAKQFAEASQESGISYAYEKTFSGMQEYLDSLAVEIAPFRAREQRLESELREAELQASRPILGHFAIKKLNDAREAYAACVNPYVQRLIDQEQRLAEKPEELKNLYSKLVKLREEIKRLEKLQQNLGTSVNQIDSLFVKKVCEGNDSERKIAHLYNPSDDKDLKHERDLLFLRALQVTREFIHGSNRMKNNLNFMRAYWGKKTMSAEGEKGCRIRFDESDRKLMAPVLFQTLNLLTPVISSTFASIGRMLRDVEIGENKPIFGLLIVDEAGQAVPYAALGALARSRRAMVVGDPSQIEPVLTEDLKQIRNVLGRGLPPLFTCDTSSVQQLADVGNPYGHLREDGSWVGCPLVVHRRCISPMFDISNEISYDGSMLNETRDPKPSIEEKFYFKSSQWINVIGAERGNRDHYVDKQGDKVFEIVEASFRKYGAKPDQLFIIAPFKTVVRGIKDKLSNSRPKDIAESAWSDFIDNNIGTVHTFQGREAYEVVFVLGCDTSKRASGAIEWVNSNIVNVAASRAKYRLYVVGDYAAWKANEFVERMKYVLDTAWVSHWKNYLSSGNSSELEKARRMLPIGVSLPLEAKESPDDEGGANGKLLERNTDYYLENIGNDLNSAVTDDDCKLIGYSSIAELQEAFDDCKEDSTGKNRVVENIMQGLLLCKIFSIGDQEMPYDGDCSFCLLMFCRAAERFLRLKLFPALKMAVPDSKAAGKPLKNLEHLNLGQYARVISREDDILSKCGASASHGLEGWREVCDPDWWKRLRKTLEEFSTYRNNACHAELNKSVGTEEVHQALCCLFKPYLLNNGARSVEIMRQQPAFMATLAGASCCTAGVQRVESGLVVRKDEEVSSNGGTEKQECQFVDQAEAKAKGYVSIASLVKDGGFNATKANGLLIQEGLLEEKEGRKLPTQKGERLGIISVRGDGFACAYYPSEIRNEIIKILKGAQKR